MEIIRPQSNITPGSQPQTPIEQSATAKPAITSAAEPQPVSAPIETTEPEVIDLESVVAEISSYVQDKQRSLHFRVSESGPAIIEVYDKFTEQLIREIPSQEAQRIAELLRDQFDGGLMLKLEV